MWIIAIYTYILSYMQIEPMVLKLESLKQKLINNSINLIGIGGKKYLKKHIFPTDSKFSISKV